MVLDFGLFVLTLFSILSLTAVISYFPEARPAFMLLYVPGIIISSTQSLSYGINNLIVVLGCFGGLTYLEMHGYKLLLSTPVNYADMTNAWKISTLITFFILIVLSVMSFYFSSILRKRTVKINHLAEINRKLYQRSKTTSDEIISSMKEALVVVDNDFKIVQYNKAFRALVGHKTSLTNEKIDSLDVKIIKSLTRYLIDIKAGKTKNIQISIKDKFFHKYDINVSPIDLQNNKIGYIVLINESSMPWGSVFNSENNKPIELALIRLMKAEDRKVIETKVTDHEGKFSFVIPPGSYYLSVSKEGFEFPSKKAKNGYHGEKIDIASVSESLIKINIPVDPLI